MEQTFGGQVIFPPAQTFKLMMGNFLACAEALELNAAGKTLLSEITMD